MCIFGVVVIYQVGLGNSGAYSVVISVIVGEFPVYSPAELFAFVIEKSVIFHGDVPYHEFYLLAQFAQIAEVREDARIVERDFGELDGARFTEDVRHRLYQEKVQGAESLEEVAARMAEAFDEYVQQYDGDILVVSHGAAITALLKRLDPQLQRMHVHLNNASFSLLEWKDGAFTVINYNLDAAYLNGGEDDDE